MALYRVTIRYGGGSSRYEVLDVEAGSLRAALREAAEILSEEAVATADLAEVRLQEERAA